MTGFRKSKVERREGGGGSERRSRREMCTNTPERAHSTSAPSSHDLSTLAASVVSAICAVQAPANTPAQHAAHVLEGSACTAPPEAVTPPQTEEEDEMVVVSAPEQGESAHATSQEDQREERASRKRALADLSDPFEEGAILDYLVPAKRERNARRKTKKARQQDQGTPWAVQVMESKGEGDQREVKIWYLVPDPEHPKDLSKRQPLEKEICRKRIVWQSPGWVKVTDPCLRRPKQDVAREQKAKKQKARNEKKEEALQKKEQKQAAKLAAAAAKAGVPLVWEELVRYQTLTEAERTLFQETVFYRNAAGTSVFADFWVEKTNRFLRKYTGHFVRGKADNFADFIDCRLYNGDP